MERKIYPEFQPVKRKGNKFGILMIHNIGGGPQEFNALMNEIESSQYSVEVPLLQGHGSHRKDLKEVQWQDWFNSLKHHLFNLRRSCQKIIVIGKGVGANFALHLSAHYQIEGVIALAPGLKRIRNKFMLSKLLKKQIDNLVLTGGDGNYKHYYSKIPSNTIQELNKFSQHCEDDLADVHTPLLVIHGVYDPMHVYEEGERIYRFVASTNKKILKLEHSGNAILQDREKSIALREITVFIEKIFQHNSRSNDRNKIGID